MDFFLLKSKNPLKRRKRVLPKYTKGIQQEHQNYEQKEQLSIKSCKESKEKNPEALTHAITITLNIKGFLHKHDGL